MPITHAESVHRLAAEIARFRTVLDSADLDAAVPACPEWRVRDLVGHLASVHRWVGEVVRTGQPADRPDPPAGDGALRAWFVTGAADLLTVLDEAAPEAPCWTFAPPGRTVFWSRRQLHETAVHRVDLEQALDVVTRLDLLAGSDGVDEVVSMLFPRQVRLGRQAPLPDSLALVDRSSGRRWLLDGDGSAAVTSPAPGGPGPDATLTGDADQIMLLLWRRSTLDTAPVTIDGDAGAARRVLTAALTP